MRDGSTKPTWRPGIRIHHGIWSTLRPPRNAGHWLIAVDAEPVGYVRWQHVDRETLDELGLLEVPGNSVDIDILLGDVASTGKGIGPAALNLVARRFLPDTSVPQLGLTTSVHNSRAHRSFAKAGFVITRQYQPPGLELCHLMIRDIAAERGTSNDLSGRGHR